MTGDGDRIDRMNHGGRWDPHEVTGRQPAGRRTFERVPGASCPTSRSSA